MLKLRTDKLRHGDKVHTNGAVIMIDGEPDVSEDRQGRPQFAWRNAPILAGELDFAPQAGFWTVQGGTASYWRVTRARS